MVVCSEKARKGVCIPVVSYIDDSDVKMDIMVEIIELLQLVN